MKPLEWFGDSLECIRRFPGEARRASGYQLERVQAGEDPGDFKHMPSVGLGVQEIRVRIGGAFRVIYVAKFSEAIYVLHAFQKKSRQTDKSDIELARHGSKPCFRKGNANDYQTAAHPRQRERISRSRISQGRG